MGHNLGKRGQYGNMPKIKKKTFFFSKITKADHKLSKTYVLKIYALPEL